ncbi:MAG: RagB/SusD family nutrient uptake outer membrane protein [Gemmatimonadota bacterium]
MRRKLFRLGILGRNIPALALGATLFLAGCGALDDLLSVDAPSRVVASDLDDPNAANLLVSSVGNEFRCTFTHYAAASALTGNEMGEATNTTVLTIWDTRIHDTSGYGSQYASTDCGSGQPALYLPLSRTRWLGAQVLESLNEWTDEAVSNRSQKIAEVSLYTAYTYLLFAEAFCDNEMAFDGGPRQSREATWSTAVTLFDQAIVSGTADVVNAARVGKGRALLNLGQYGDAASAVGSVPEGFSWELPYSNAEAVTRNKLWELNARDEEITVEPIYRDVMFDGVPDPRISVTDVGTTGAGSTIPIFTADKYPSADSPQEVASWEEAQLIIAEANARAGNPAELAAAVDIINVLHDNAGLPDFSSTDQADILAQIEYERMAEFFLEGQHLHDLWRFDQDLVPATGEDHPFGAFYGDEICFDLPAVEFLNNPNAAG